jgi:D-alanine-D-alanine ligase
VDRLEPHVPREWWKGLFNETYLQTDGDVVENDENTRQDIDLVLSTVPLVPSHRILDLCCGQGRHSLELCRRGFLDVTGFDQSAYLIQIARNRARSGGLDVPFHEGDARDLPLASSSCDAVLVMGNSFGYLEDEAGNLGILEEIRRILKPSGILLLDLTDGGWIRENFERRSWEWIDRTRFACRERELSANGKRLVCREIVVDIRRGVTAENFYAERLYAETEIAELLGGLGFHTPIRSRSVTSGSTRNQDLGLMSHRMLVSAFAEPR